MEWDKIWSMNRKNIDGIAGKFTCVEKAKTSVLTITNVAEGTNITTHPIHPKNESLGTKPVFFGKKVFLESDDVVTLKEDQKVTLMRFGNVKITKISEKDKDGNFTLEGESLPEDKDFKTTVKLTWLIADPSVLSTVQLIEYGHLLTKQSLEDEDKLEDFINYNSKFVTEAWAEPHVKN